MKLKNIGSKIVNVGDVTILPGDTSEVKDAYADNAAIDCLVEMGNLSIVKEKPTTPKPPRKPANEKPANEKPAEEPKTGGEQQPEPEKEPETKKE